MIDNEFDLNFDESDDELLTERLDEPTRRDYANRLSRVCNVQVILHNNGIFYIYNVRENEVDYLLAKLRNLDFVENVYKNRGQLDFTRIKQSGYGVGLDYGYKYTISGHIKE